MKFITTFLAIAGIASAQIDRLPKCASQCYATAVGASGCGLADAYCLCTTGMKAILEVAVPCLCKSPCTSEELLQAQDASNVICEAALKSKGEIYHAATLSPNVCAGAANSGGTSAPASAPATISPSTQGGYGGITSTAAPASTGLSTYGGYVGGNATSPNATATGTAPIASYTGAAAKVASWVSELGMIGLAVWALFA